MILLLVGGMGLFFILLIVGYYFYKNSDSDSVNNEETENEEEDTPKNEEEDTNRTNAVGQSNIQVNGDDTDNLNVNNERNEYTGGGLDEAPPMPGEEESVEDDNSQLCTSSLCTGGKVLISSTAKGNTEDKCCRDKFCSEDWDPVKNPSDPCRQFGMQYNRDSQWNGNSKEQCCKVDTTSYSKWCVQRVARKPDGTFEKTRSPIPYKGGHGFNPYAHNGTPHKKSWARAHWDGYPDNEHNWKDGVIGYVVGDVADWEHHNGRPSRKGGKTEWSAQGGYQFTGTKESNLNKCKNKCNEYDDCGGFFLTKEGGCFLKKPLTMDGLRAAYELNNEEDSSVDSSDAHEFYINSKMVPENMRHQTIDGQIKIAGIDEEYCPFKYTSIYGVSNWGPSRNKYGGVHEYQAPGGGNLKCYGPGGKHHGVSLMTKNSTLPIVHACSQLCDAVSGCEAFWAYLPTHYVASAALQKYGWTQGVDDYNNTGKCCLKGKKTFTSANTKLERKHSKSIKGHWPMNPSTRGAYFVKVKNGKMGVRSWRKSLID